jgi:cell division protein FtsA
VAKAGYEEMIPAGVVLTGGTANLAGIVELAERVLQMPARAGPPGGIYNLHETLENTAFATSIGLLGWAVREHDAVLRPSRRYRPDAAGAEWGVWQRVRRVVKAFST